MVMVRITTSTFISIIDLCKMYFYLMHFLVMYFAGCFGKIVHFSLSELIQHKYVMKEMFLSN